MRLCGCALAETLADDAAAEVAVATVTMAIGIVADGIPETATAFAGDVIALGLGDVLTLELVAAALLLAAARSTVFSAAPLFSSFDFDGAESCGYGGQARGGQRFDGAAAWEAGDERPGQAVEAVAVHERALSGIDGNDDSARRWESRRQRASSIYTRGAPCQAER